MSFKNYSSQILADGAIGYWRLGEVSGSVANDSYPVAGNNGTYAGGVTLGQIGALDGDNDGAALFNGSTGYVALSNPAALRITGDLTVEAWVKRLSSNSYDMIIAFASTTTALPYNFYINTGATGLLELDYADGAGIEQRTSSISFPNDGLWHHVAATRGSARVILYIDGVERGNLAQIITPTSSVDGMYIGRRSDGHFFDGLIDDVAVYNVALTGAQIKLHYDMGRSRRMNAFGQGNQPWSVSVSMLATDATRTLKAAPGVGRRLVVTKWFFRSMTSAAQTMQLLTSTVLLDALPASITVGATIEGPNLENGIVCGDNELLRVIPAAAGPAGLWLAEGYIM